MSTKKITIGSLYIHRTYEPDMETYALVFRTDQHNVFSVDICGDGLGDLYPIRDRAQNYQPLGDDTDLSIRQSAAAYKYMEDFSHPIVFRLASALDKLFSIPATYTDIFYTMSHADIILTWEAWELFKKEYKIDEDIVSPPRQHYAEWRTSWAWRQTCEDALFRGGHRCAKCGATDDLQVHHKTYEHLGEEFEHLDDLMVLCRKCHEKEHGIKHNKNKRR